MFLTQHKFSILNSKKVLCCIEIGGKSSLPKLLFKKQTIYYSILCYFFLMFIAPLIHIYVYIHTHKSVANLMLAKGEKTQNQKYSGEKSKKKKKDTRREHEAQKLYYLYSSVTGTPEAAHNR